MKCLRCEASLAPGQSCEHAERHLQPPTTVTCKLCSPSGRPIPERKYSLPDRHERKSCPLWKRKRSRPESTGESSGNRRVVEETGSVHSTHMHARAHARAHARTRSHATSFTRRHTRMQSRTLTHRWRGRSFIGESSQTTKSVAHSGRKRAQQPCAAWNVHMQHAACNNATSRMQH